MRESLYTRIIIWVNTLLKHIDTRMIIPRYESSCMVYRPKQYQKQNYCQISLLIERYEILIIDLQMVSKRDDTNSTLVQTTYTFKLGIKIYVYGVLFIFMALPTR